MKSETIVKDLSVVKKGDCVWRIMYRYNPQTGNYLIFEVMGVAKVTSASIINESGDKYDKVTGERKDKVRNIYGWSEYVIAGDDRAKEIIAEHEAKGYSKSPENKVGGFHMSIRKRAN